MAKIGRKKIKRPSRLRPKLSDKFPWKAKGLRKPRLKARELIGPAASPLSSTTTTTDVEVVDHSPTRPRPHVGYDKERAAYGREKSALLRDCEGSFVVFVGDEMIGPFADFRSALESGLRTFGTGPLYIKQVLADEPAAESGTAESCRS